MSGGSMPSADRKQLGRFGESAAAAYLLRNGYQLLMRNWRCVYGEIDLVTQLSGQIVFVEVRTRRSGIPEESIGPTKRRRLITLAHSYCAEHNLPETLPWRIDLIAVVLDGSGRITRLSHIEHAVESD